MTGKLVDRKFNLIKLDIFATVFAQTNINSARCHTTSQDFTIVISMDGFHEVVNTS